MSGKLPGNKVPARGLVCGPGLGSGRREGLSARAERLAATINEVRARDGLTPINAEAGIGGVIISSASVRHPYGDDDNADPGAFYGASGRATGITVCAGVDPPSDNTGIAAALANPRRAGPRRLQAGLTGVLKVLIKAHESGVDAARALSATQIAAALDCRVTDVKQMLSHMEARCRAAWPRYPLSVPALGVRGRIIASGARCRRWRWETAPQ